MSTIPSQSNLLPPLLDRLIAAEADAHRLRHGYDLQEMTDAVRRDLEELLNARRSYGDLPEDFAELRDSVLTYGMPDLVSSAVNSPEERRQVGRRIEEVIARFEPRLREVRITLTDSASLHDLSLRFHIEARLNVDPAPEVVFETVVELASGETSIRTGEPSA